MTLKFSPRVAWQKWRDPYTIEDEPELDTEKTDNWEDDDDDEDTGIIFDNMVPLLKKRPMKMVMTPMGAVPLPEHSAPDKVFNFWVGHTNFDISKKVFEIVEHTPGVETIDIFSRYRMRIGVGKLFKTNEVLSNITNKLAEIFK